MFQKYPENLAFQLFIILQWFAGEICYFLKSSPLFKSFYSHFLFIRKTLRFNDVQTRTVGNAKISVFLLFVEAIIYLLLYYLHNCTFKRIKLTTAKHWNQINRVRFTNPFTCNILIHILQPWTIVA